MTEFDRVRNRDAQQRAAAARASGGKRKVTFNTSDFYRAHSRAPRGRGSWAFVDAQFAERDNYLDFVFWANGLYADAKKAAAAHFAAQTDFSGEVVVLS